jgi:hypothetical protein
MKWDGSPLDESARAVEDALEEELGVRPYAVDETEPGTLVVRYSPVDLEPAAFADAVDGVQEETAADVRAGELSAKPGRVHERDLVAMVTGPPAR